MDRGHKRNIDLYRDILLELRTSGREFTITGYPEKDVHQAAGELRRQGYLLGTTRWVPGAAYEQVMPRRLTKKGEALARAIESGWVWAQVKRWLPRPEDRTSLEVVQRVAERVDIVRN